MTIQPPGTELPMWEVATVNFPLIASHYDVAEDAAGMNKSVRIKGLAGKDLILGRGLARLLAERILSACDLLEGQTDDK